MNKTPDLKGDEVGEAWQRHIEKQSYGSAGDTRALNKFRASPYIQTIVQYAQLKSNSLILEPGCGSGKFSLALASCGHRVIALDYVDKILTDIRQTEFRLDDTWPGRIWHYTQGSLERLPFQDDTFDLILNEGVVEHWLDDAERLFVLSEMARVTKPGGVVAVFVPNGAHPLIDSWDNRLEAIQNTPPMTYYDTSRLGRELQAAGLGDIKTEGIYPWRSWTRLTPWDRFYLLSAALDHWLPLPKKLREKWAINIAALGRKRAAVP
jgi:SAM-dependent methyltransferase